MINSRIAGSQAQSLSALGISESEERLYRWLLVHSGATSRDIAQAISLSSRKAQQLLDQIESKGLTTHSPERPSSYLPSAPDIALRALFLHQQEALLSTQLTIQELQEEINTTKSDDEQEHMVELVTSHEAEIQIVEQMQSSAQQELLVLMRVPLRISRTDMPAEEARSFQEEAQNRGVRHRSIVDTELMASPELVTGMREDIRAGEEVRVFPSLPLKMIMADRKLALIPLNLERLDTPSLLVRSSALLDALHSLFELLWERSSPISLFGKSELKAGDPNVQLSGQAKELISLMAAGLNDKSMSCELGVTTRTLQSRVTNLMQVLGARTRFQVGWLAALRLATAGAIPDVQLRTQK